MIEPRRLETRRTIRRALLPDDKPQRGLVSGARHACKILFHAADP
jgi:hypothetical protein